MHAGTPTDTLTLWIRRFGVGLSGVRLRHTNPRFYIRLGYSVMTCRSALAFLVSISMLCGCSSSSTNIYKRELVGKDTFCFAGRADEPTLGVEVERIIQLLEGKGYAYAPGNKTGVVISLNFRERNNPRGTWSNLQRSMTASVDGKPIVTYSGDEDWAHLFKSYDTARDSVLNQMCAALDKGIPSCAVPSKIKANSASVSSSTP